MEKRIGIFGGSFNPIHIGHLIIAEAAWREFKLEKIIFIPTGDTPNKNMNHIDKMDRFKMVKLAICDNDHFSISSIEIKRSGPSYTVDTIHEIQKELPEAYQLYFIAGTDAVADLPHWRYNRELLNSCHFICASRRGSREEMERSVNYFGELGKRKIHFLKTPELEISSTILREWIYHGYSVKYMIPDSVIQYINKYKLYRGAE